MDTALFLAAYCFVSITDVDLALATNSMRQMPFLHSINRFCEVDELKHTPEDEDHVWMSGIFRVPDHQLGVKLRVLSGLPYFQTLTMPGKDVVRDENMQMRFHPRFSGERSTTTDKGKGRERQVNGEVSEDTSDEMNDAEEAADDQAQETVVEAEAQTAAVEVIEVQDDSADEMDVTGDDVARAGPAHTHADHVLIPPELPRLAEHRIPEFVVVPAPRPPGVPTSLCRIDSLWNRFWGRGEADPDHLPPLWPAEAHFPPLSSISMYSNRTKFKEFYTNVVGKVDLITEPTLTNKAPFWRLQLSDLNNEAHIVCAFMFPQPDTNFELGAALPGLNVGDMVMIFNVQVPEETNYVSVKDDSAIFLSLRPDQCGVEVVRHTNG